MTRIERTIKKDLPGKVPMVWIIFGIIALVAISLGYFLNIYTVLIVVLSLFAYIIYDTRRQNNAQDQDKKSGSILVNGLYIPFALIMLISSIITNFPLMASLARTFVEWVLRLILR